MPRRDPQAELAKALDRSAGSRLVRVQAGDVVALCDALPADPDLTASQLRKGCEAVPAHVLVAVGSAELRAVLERTQAAALKEAAKAAGG